MATPKPERGAPREPYNSPIRVYGVSGDASGKELAELKKLVRDLQEAIDRGIRNRSFIVPWLEQDAERADWGGLILVDRRILGGKPVIRGTRVPVAVIMKALYAGESPESVRHAHGITENELLAAVWYATESPAARASSPKRRKPRKR